MSRLDFVLIYCALVAFEFLIAFKQKPPWKWLYVAIGALFAAIAIVVAFT